MKKKCPIEFTLSLINGKWKILIMKELSHAPLRYGAVVKCIPNVSPKVLIQQLRVMEEDGLIVRTVFPEVPPRVEYSLSEKGISIISIFMELRRWGLEANETEKVECTLCGKCQQHIAKYQNSTPQ
ncbi:MAG: helix-turn-helix transcriptional regulator [Deltaproteobacteria bacterium]|jgi:DNA-binding HxlR family transcriptional regulator|nr:helix-turn-helix transcriptional regulator [Deltaproteobacteria bacterium]